MIRAHYWLKFMGFNLMIVSLTTAGLIQSAGWAMGMPIDQWGLQIRPYWFFRELSGIMIFLGQSIFAYNVWKTLYAKPVLATQAIVPGKAKVEVKA
jgi:cytochrome c oxidase cbb3-type subunit 1/cytochrome c oxidase cbb3-type subunit I/II